MIKVKCKNCNYKLEKPQWEHIIYQLRIQGGHAGKNICPNCKEKSLEINFDDKYTKD